jgi:hypothetical protein
VSKRFDDAGALFKPFWRDVNGFREFNREAEASHAENRWPLVKSMAIDARFTLPALSRRQKQGWLEQETSERPGHGTDSALSRVFRRIERAASPGQKAKW